jgi:outer membrane protein
MHMPQKDDLILTDSITEDKIKSDILSDDYRYEDRKEYQLLMLGKKLGEYNVSRYKLSNLPTLSANAGYSKNAQRQDFDFFKGGSEGQWFTTSFIGVKLNVPIFDGFARNSRVKKAKLQLEQTNNDIDSLKESIDNDVVQARLKITAAVVTIDNQKQNMQLAEKVYNSTRLKYEQGLGSNIEIVNAQADLRQAQNNYYSALYDAIIAKIDYLKATGKL